jgi:hypothetical protein
MAESRLGCSKDYVSLCIGVSKSANVLTYLPLNEKASSTSYQDRSGKGIGYSSSGGAAKYSSLLPTGRGSSVKLVQTGQIASTTAFSQNQQSTGCAFWLRLFSTPLLLDAPIVSDTYGGAGTQALRVTPSGQLRYRGLSGAVRTLVGRSSVERLSCFQLSLEDRSSGLTVPLRPSSIATVVRIGRGLSYPFATSSETIAQAAVATSTDSWTFCGFTANPYSALAALPLHEVRVLAPEPALFLPGLSSTHLSWALVTNKTARLHQVSCHAVSNRLRRDAGSTRLLLEDSKITVELASSYPGAMDRGALVNPAHLYAFETECQDVERTDQTDLTSTAARRGRSTANATLVIKNCTSDLAARVAPPLRVAKAGLIDVLLVDGRFVRIALNESLPWLLWNGGVLPSNLLWATSVESTDCTNVFPQTGDCLPSAFTPLSPSMASSSSLTLTIVGQGFGFI